MGRCSYTPTPRAGVTRASSAEAIGTPRTTAWDAVGGLSDLLSRRLGVPVFERRAEDCAEYQITHDEGESANKNHALVSLGTEALVGIAQGGRQVAFRRGAYANLSQRLAGMCGRLLSVWRRNGKSHR